MLDHPPSIENPLAVPRRQRGRWVGLREFAIFAAAYLTYFGVRALTEGKVPEALANAGRIAHVERLAGVDWEGAAQSAILGHDALVRLANWVYIFGHWPLLLLAGVLLFRHRPQEYYLLRDVCLISGAVGLIIFALFPVAPPRLAGGGVVDTITHYAGGYRTVLPSSLVNEYAAMPSFHAGWSVLLGIVVFRASSRWRAARVRGGHPGVDGGRRGGDRQPLRPRRPRRHGHRAGDAARGRPSQSRARGSYTGRP